MSDHKKEAKAASAAKMQRMGLKLDDGSKSFTDERGGSPFEGLNSGNAGKWPVTPSRFKRGGKVGKHADMEGHKAHKNLGKAPRKAAGGSSNMPVPVPPRKDDQDYNPYPYKLTKAQMAALHESEYPNDPSDLGSKTTGYARGGITGMNPAARKKMVGAMVARKKMAGMPSAAPSKGLMPSTNPYPSSGLIPMRKSGGVAKHTDEAQDKKLMHKVLKKEAFKADGGSTGRRRYDQLDELDQMFAPLRRQKEEQRKRGQESSINSMEGLGSKKPIERQTPTHWPVYQENPELRKEKLKEARMYDSFQPKRGPYHEKALQEEYFDQDKNASLTSSGLKRGGKAMHHADCSCKMCSGGMAERAHRASGGRTKGKTNVNIIISPQSGQQSPLGAGVGMGQPPMPPQMPPMGGIPPMPPGGGMPPAGGAPQLPPQLMAALAARGGAGGPPMPRKSGGRVGQAMPKYQEKDYGSGSGLGRLEKKKWPTANGTE